MKLKKILAVSAFILYDQVVCNQQVENFKKAISPEPRIISVKEKKIDGQLITFIKYFDENLNEIIGHAIGENGESISIEKKVKVKSGKNWE